MGPPDELDFLENMMRYAPDLVCVVGAQGQLRRVSAACQQVLGYASDELVGKSFADIVHHDDRAAALAACLGVARPLAAPAAFECRCLGKAGQEVSVEWSAFGPPAGELVFCLGRDVTQQRQAVQQALGQEALHRTLIEHGFDMVALIDEKGVYIYVGGSTSKYLGYSAEEMVGLNGFDLIHPDDLARVQAQWSELSTRPVVTLADFRFRTAAGEWRWIETTVSNQMHNPAIRAYAISSRDTTEQNRRAFELAESEQRFRLLFENNPSLAVFQGADGVVLNANPAFLAFVGKPKPEVVGRPLAELLPPDVRLLIEQKRAEAAGGQEAHFETAVLNGKGEKKTLSVSIVPLVVDGQMIGVHLVAQDITEVIAAQCLIKRQAEQLTATLESITDAFFSVDKDDNLTYLNRETERILQVNRQDCLGRNIWSVFPEEFAEIYARNHQHSVEAGNTAHFEAFSTHSNRWLDVKIFPSPEGLSVYFSDITDRIEAEKQLKLLALVAQDTDNGVVITDAAGVTEWVNAGFTKHTGYELADVLGKRPGEVLQGPETDPATVQHIRERMKRQVPFSATILNYKKSGQKLWYAMDITPIRNDAGELVQFIAIQQNINYRKEIEASQAKMTQDLYRHNRDLQQFTYVVSHNLRAPLANALGLATLLTKMDKNTESFDVSLAHLRKSMGQADTVLKDLNVVLAIRDKQDALEPVQDGLLAEVCQQAIVDLEEALAQCGGQVKLDIEDGLAVRGNRAYLYSIFYNLLSNSIKYRADERALEVKIECVRGERGGASISFIDNGSGFDMYKAGSDIFQLYKRFHTNQRGRGIGLFLVKTHVEAMGGRIEVASGVDFGTRFLIHLDKS